MGCRVVGRCVMCARVYMTPTHTPRAAGGTESMRRVALRPSPYLTLPPPATHHTSDSTGSRSVYELSNRVCSVRSGGRGPHSQPPRARRQKHKGCSLLAPSLCLLADLFRGRLAAPDVWRDRRVDDAELAEGEEAGQDLDADEHEDADGGGEDHPEPGRELELPERDEARELQTGEDGGCAPPEDEDGTLSGLLGTQVGPN
mmetsp:Transcript_32011/g.95223  ORF Transcript_32011/g.95223 Transcript_32011/m.95223 type:complete len:201 (+) Transcript_32011:544-1146(+)